MSQHFLFVNPTREIDTHFYGNVSICCDIGDIHFQLYTWLRATLILALPNQRPNNLTVDLGWNEWLFVCKTDDQLNDFVTYFQDNS